MNTKKQIMWAHIRHNTTPTAPTQPAKNQQLLSHFPEKLFAFKQTKINNKDQASTASEINWKAWSYLFYVATTKCSSWHKPCFDQDGSAPSWATGQGSIFQDSCSNPPPAIQRPVLMGARGFNCLIIHPLREGMDQRKAPLPLLQHPEGNVSPGEVPRGCI